MNQESKVSKCRECDKILAPGDLFCRYCGTPRGQGTFRPETIVPAPVYGPPTITTHECTNCHYSWYIKSFGVDDAQYCPKCKSPLWSRWE